MPLRLATTTRNAMVDAWAVLLSGGTVEVRTGTQPATPQASASGTLLATITLEAPAYGSGSAGVATLVDPDAVTAVAVGTATWARAKTSGGAAVMDGPVTTTGGGGLLELSTVTITIGLSVDVTGGSLTQPES